MNAPLKLNHLKNPLKLNTKSENSTQLLHAQDWEFLTWQLSLLAILVAPVAYGKTFFLKELYFKFGGPWIYFSPLQALALEVYDNLKKDKIPVYFYKIQKTQNPQLSLRNFFKDLQKKTNFYLIVTSNQCQEEFFHWFESLKSRPIVVIDEFHLIHQWGQTFRPNLLDIFFDFSIRGGTIFALTATLSEEFFKTIKNDYQFSFDHIYQFTIGNHQLKYSPEKIYYFAIHCAQHLHKIFHYQLLFKHHIKNIDPNRQEENKGTLLYFCSKRSQVDIYVERYRRLGIKVLGCKSGEVEHFRDELIKGSTPLAIFATTCLSHGVNLPPISNVFINDPNINKDIWIQMMGRGGRNGEAYKVYTLDILEVASPLHKIYCSLKAKFVGPLYYLYKAIYWLDR
jgi:ATP-dependent DNA helicase RecQ